MNKAKFVEEIKVIDPDTKGEVNLSVYKHENGGMFAIDSSFLEQVARTDDDYRPVISDPFNDIEDEATEEVTLMDDFSDVVEDEATENENDPINDIKDEATEEVLLIKKENDPIYDIIKRKKAGIDCTEAESAEIKGWLNELKIPFEQPTLSEVQLLFPQEYSEFIDSITQLPDEEL